MIALRTILVCFAYTIIATIAWGDKGVIRLTSFPSMTVADGRSTTTISAEVRDRNGKIVPDGTQVVFSTTLGVFNEPIVKTSAGIARTVFSAGSVPGAARITASSLGISAVSTIDLEIVSDRSMLSTAKEFIEVTADDYLMYSMDQRIIGAASPERGVTVRFRDVLIQADDVQVNVPAYEVRARKALLKIGAFEQSFEELYFRVNAKVGHGLTTIEVPNYEIIGNGNSFRFQKSMKSKLGLVDVTRTGIAPAKAPVPPAFFEFADLLDSTSTVSAKKAVAFPRGQIQFHQAEMYVGTKRLMRMPLFQVNMFGSSPLVTDQVINVYNSKLAVNYPYYLSLKPGETSALRLRTGEQYGRTSTSLGGLFLDYEMNWNRGDDMDGGLTFSGITRGDWSVGARQYMRLGPRTTASMQLEFPAHKSIYGSANLNQQFDGFQFALNASNTRTLRGPKFQSSQYTAILEKDPTKIGNLPMRLFYGLTANYSSSVTQTTSLLQNTVGARVRTQLMPLNLDSRTSVSGSFSVSHLTGQGAKEGLTTLGELSLSRNFGPGASIFVTYNYADDGYNSRLTGRNSVSVNGIYENDRLSIGFSALKSLDADRVNYFFDGSYRLGDVWRLSYEYTFDQFLGDRYIEDLAMLSYRFGVREIGVTYSIKRRRFGFQLFGTQFN